MDNIKKINVNVLVTLDSVLDTRHPTIFGLHSPTAATMLEDDKYHLRITDRFGDIPYSIFKSFYNRRNKNILKLALPTPILSLIAEYCAEGYHELSTVASKTAPVLYVNIYPYTLSDDEKGKLLMMFHNVLNVPYGIKIIRMSPKEVTPDYIQRHVTTYIDYDIVEWVEYHTANGTLPANPITGVSCVGPLIANGHKPLKKIEQDDFEELMCAVAPYCTLTLVQSRLFCLDN